MSSEQRPKKHKFEERNTMKLRSRPMLVILALLSTGIPVKADTGFTFTGWLSGVPLPGIQCTNAAGQVYLIGNLHAVRVLASDPLVTGRLDAWMDMTYQVKVQVLPL